MNNLLNAVGWGQEIWQDWVDETLSLLDRLSLGIHDGSAANTLLRAFNDMDEATSSMSIITYFKVCAHCIPLHLERPSLTKTQLLTSAWIQTHSTDYQHFLEYGQSTKEYCSINIDPVNTEIDHLGVSALSEALLKPAGFALHVLYLDRTPGEEINLHQFGATEADALSLHGLPTLRLLYRP